MGFDPECAGRTRVVDQTVDWLGHVDQSEADDEAPHCQPQPSERRAWCERPAANALLGTAEEETLKEKDGAADSPCEVEHACHAEDWQSREQGAPSEPH